MEAGKKVRLILLNGFHYQGKVLEISDSHLKILDKFGAEVLIAKSQIQVMEEVQNGN